MKTIFIYALTDPDTGEIRYIGKSINPWRRANYHMQEKSHCHRVYWLQSLRRQGKKPGVVIIEEIRGAWPWQESERFWIRYALAHGVRLVNNTSGGDGVNDLPAETRAKMALTWKGRKHKPESLIKIALASTGRKHSEESKQRMRVLMAGRKITWIAKIAEAQRKLTKSDCEEILRRRGAGELNQDLAKEFGVHRTTLSKIKNGTYFNE